jgi:hypothetical protein
MPSTLTGELGAVRERLLEFFRQRKTRAGVLARRLFKIPSPEDPELVEHLIRERRRQTRLDGSMEGGLVATAWCAWELLQLDCPPDHAGVVRTVGYLLRQQDQPGRYGEGCDPERHERAACHHVASGFFSPGTVEQKIAPLTFPSGVTVSDETDARFAASCFALRTVIKAHEDRRDSVRRHLNSLLELPGLWSDWGGRWHPDLVFFALGPLALVPLDLRAKVAPLVSYVASQQNPDGGWTGASPFHAVEMLSLAPLPEARESVARSAPLLCNLIQESESLETPVGEERALITLRALKAAES